MSQHWPDLPGITRVGDHARLPRRPGVAAALFDEACLGARGLADLVERVQRRTQDERVRIEGLAAWLPLSHVAVWGADGALRLHPETSPFDLALRYGAWVGGQPVAPEHVERVTAYCREVVEPLARRRDRVGGPAWGGAADAAPDDDLQPDAALSERLSRLIAALDASLLERRPHVRAVLLALLSRQHALLLGPPGTAKSQLARAVAACFREVAWFEYLLSRFTHPDELFGPVSIPGLKEEDYRRLTEGFLPTAQVAFLDEIFKANSAILNSLLTLVNERVFHHGRHRDVVPLIGLVGASNELPDADGGLGALFDRFLVRVTVPPLAEAGAFLTVATGEVGPPQIDPADALTPADLDALARAADAVVVPDDVRAALLALWRAATEQGWSVSDRRWRQAVGSLKTAAAAEGRAAVGLLDLLLLEHVLAPDPRDAAAVRDRVVEIVAPRALPAHDLRAQWTLLRLDRVAPRAGEPLSDEPGRTWEERLAHRRVHAARLVSRVEDAIATLAADRQRVAGAGSRLWLPDVPARVLAAHLEAGRELARLLDLAERYRRALGDPVSVAAALVERLPEPVRRDFAAGVALRLRLSDAPVDVGLSLAGERIPSPGGEVEEEPVALGSPGRLSRRGAARASFEAEAFARAPVLTLTSAEWIGLLRREVDLETLLPRVDASGGRHALAVLQQVRKRLGDSGVPAPPAWDPGREGEAPAGPEGWPAR